MVAKVCAIEQNGEVTVLRAANWKNPLKLRIAERARDALLPIYVGPSLGHLMRSKTECSTANSLLTAAIAEHDALAARAIFGRFPLDADHTAMIDATIKWITNGDDRDFYRLYHAIPQMVRCRRTQRLTFGLAQLADQRKDAAHRGGRDGLGTGCDGASNASSEHDATSRGDAEHLVARGCRKVSSINRSTRAYKFTSDADFSMCILLNCVISEATRHCFMHWS